MLLSNISSLQLPSGHSGPVLTLSNATHSSPFSPHLLVADVSIWGTFLLGVAFTYVICGFYLFFLPVMLPSEIWKLPTDSLVKGFPGVWKLPLLRCPTRNPLSFIFCPTSFQRQWAAFQGTWWPQLRIRSCFVKFALYSVILLMNLWERKWSARSIPLPSWLLHQSTPLIRKFSWRYTVILLEGTKDSKWTLLVCVH